MQTNTKLFKTPFSKEYWLSAISEVKSVKMLVIAAIFVALRVAMGRFFIPLPVMGTQHIYLSFIINSLGSLIYGPVMGLMAGTVSDIIGAVLFPKGPFFFGYTITSMMGSFIYGLFLYKARLSVKRLFLCKFSVNLVTNVFLNSLWPAILMNKGFWELLILRIPKNVIMLPFETALMYLFFALTLPILKRERIIPCMPYEKKITWL